MNNAFNNNSRFAGLIDKSEYDKSSVYTKSMKKNGRNYRENIDKTNDGIKAPLEAEKHENNSVVGFKSDERKVNVFKDDGNVYNNYKENRRNRYPNENERQQIIEQYAAEEKARKEFEKQEKERIKMDSLKIENFPELVIIKKENELLQKKSYLEKLNKDDETIDKQVDPDLENLKPGWVLIKKDKANGKNIMKGGVQVNKEVMLFKEKENNKTSILNELAELHERRTQEFIELNGYETWEKMFKFPNWMEKESELEDNSDEEYNDEFTDDDEY